MAEVSFIEHKGKRILKMEFPEGEDKQEASLSIIKAAKGIIANQPPESLLVLTVFPPLFQFNSEIGKTIEDFMKHNRPFIKASATVGVTGLRMTIYNSLMILAKRNVRICNTTEEAKEYLVSIEKPVL